MFQACLSVFVTDDDGEQTHHADKESEEHLKNILADFLKDAFYKNTNYINNIRLCDPAVGSGHFLVSALNELISLKSELGILCDRDGKRLRDIRAEVGNDDLYVYFVDRGMSILRAGGHFSYILPNKWMRAGYGDKLRKYFLKQRIQGISDFGDLPVFDEATTYPCILELENNKPEPEFPATLIRTLDFEERLAAYIAKNRFAVHAPSLQPSGRTLSNRHT